MEEQVKKEKILEPYQEIERALIKKFRKPIWRKFTQAINDYDMIQEGDKIAVCISGGKDSMLLAKLMQEIHRIGGWFGKKHLSLKKDGFYTYPSDQKHFPYGVGIAALRRSSWAGLYCNRIHTKKDTVLEETNVNILRAALTTFICRDAVQ